MNRPLARKVGTLVLVVLVLTLAVGVAGAREQQLAGIRLGQHAINLLDVYGQPDGVVVGGAPPATSQMAGAGVPTIGAPGVASPQMYPPSATAGMGMAAGVGGPPPGGSAPPGPGGFPAGPSARDATGTAPAAVVTQFPIWALAIIVETRPWEVEWIYNRGPVVLGFVLDRDGYIDQIIVAAEKCDYARTALWRPHQYVKLGDDFKRVLYRYGYPDESAPFDAEGPGLASPYQGQIVVSTGGGAAAQSAYAEGVATGTAGAVVGAGIAGAGSSAMGGALLGGVLAGAASGPPGGFSRVFSRDVILRYEDNNNIAFTLHNMKVTRIQIWR